MKKHIVLLLTAICMVVLIGCNNEQPSSPCVFSFTVPAGSSEIIFDSEQLYLGSSKVTISADYEVEDTNVVSVWLKDSSIKHAFEGNPYTNAVVLPNSTTEVEIEGKKWYEIGIKLTNNSDNDIPVVISIYNKGWKQ